MFDLMKFAPTYFMEEIREGFYIPTTMKRYWAGQIKVLFEIDKVCRKHGIKWFAIYGTLLGAVRHGGYIPWDDDFDICMFRKDYELFCKVAPKELPDKYSVNNLRINGYGRNMIGRVLNNSNLIAVDCDEDHMRRFYECPHTLGIDIFPMDNVYDDEEQESNRVKRLNDISIAIELIRKEDPSTHRSDAEELLDYLLNAIEEENHVMIDKKKNTEYSLLLLTEQLYSENDNDNSKDVAMMHLWAGYGINRFPRELFERSVSIQFENILINAPGRYDEVLRLSYGDYMIIHRDGGIHDYPVYEGEEKLYKYSQGHNLCRYTFNKEEFLRKYNKKSVKKDINTSGMELVKTIQNAVGNIKKLYAVNEIGYILQLLEACQNVAISLGTMFEERTCGSEDVVRCLEVYCEHLYVFHEELNNGSFEDDIEKRNEHIIVMADELIAQTEELVIMTEGFLKKRKRRVLFFPCTARWWDSMQNYYNKKCCEGVELFVMPLPYYVKDEDGTAIRVDEDGAFPNSITITEVTEYDFTHGYADEIVIQIPYDEYNTAFRVPDFFFSGNLTDYTDMLTYIPYLRVEHSGDLSNKMIKSLECLIEQPVMIYCDRIVLELDELKKVYVDKLTELSGNEYRDYWNDKIVTVVSDENSLLSNEDTTGNEEITAEKQRNYKILMYYMDIAYHIQYGKEALTKLRRNIKLFKENSDNLRCLFVKSESIDDTLETGVVYNDIMQELNKEEGFTVISYKEADGWLDKTDAYYGSAGVLAHRCRLNRKPVMIIGDPEI